MMRRAFAFRNPPIACASTFAHAQFVAKGDRGCRMMHVVARLIDPEQPFRILVKFLRNVPPDVRFNLHSRRRTNMRKLGYVIAALGAIAIAAPSIASAETVVIKRGGHHHGYGAHAMMHRDHGWHKGWRHRHADKVVIIKKRHHHHY
jgi:hypothetical protein